MDRGNNSVRGMFSQERSGALLLECLFVTMFIYKHRFLTFVSSTQVIIIFFVKPTDPVFGFPPKVVFSQAHFTSTKALELVCLVHALT